jgi:hypothetical protein
VGEGRAMEARAVVLLVESDVQRHQNVNFNANNKEH